MKNLAELKRLFFLLNFDLQELKEFMEDTEDSKNDFFLKISDLQKDINIIKSDKKW